MSRAAEPRAVERRAGDDRRADGAAESAVGRLEADAGDIGAAEDEAPTLPGRAIATLLSTFFALLTFVVALVAGAVSRVDAPTVIARAIAAMVLCWPLSWIILRVVISSIGWSDESAARHHAHRDGDGEASDDRDASSPGATNASSARSALHERSDGIELAGGAVHGDALRPSTSGSIPEPVPHGLRFRPEEKPTVRQDLRTRSDRSPARPA